ncbi:MAG: InlB B-repeat-containing protein, partial [Bacillota bacterium]
MSRQDGNIRIMGGSGYKLSLAIIAVLSVALMVFMLVILPAVNQEPEQDRRIISIEYPQGEIGVGDDVSRIYVQISYSNGETASVALSDMVYEGLDLSEPGQQNVALTYGGFEQVLDINVRSVNCQINYQASTGGVIEGETSQSIPTGQAGNRVIARAEVGYVFVNWSDGNPEPERRDTNVTADATYIANFEKARYVVVFRYPDGTVAREQIVPYNESPTQVPQPSDPKMQVYGYDFDRWSMSFDNVTQNMTIDPIFVKNATDVTVDVTENNRGETLGTLDLPSEGYYPKNQQATLRATPLQSRSFASWQIKEYDGEWVSITVEDINTQNGFRNISIGTESNNINFEAGQTGDSNEFYLVFTPNDDTNLIEIKADFVYDISAITFINSMSPNQGNIEKTVNLENGDAIGAHLTDPGGAGLGYNFIGWFKAQSGSEISDDPVQPEDTFTMPTTLVARWQKIYYSVNFLTGDGDLPPRTVYVLYQDSLASAVEEPVYTDPVATKAIPSETPSLEDYRFVGWYIVGDGNILTDEVIDEDFKVYEDINIKPKFEPVEHELTIDLNGPGVAQRKNISEEGSFEQMPAGMNIVEEINRYVYRFVADDGYQIKAVDINGEVTNYSGNVDWVDVEIFFPSQSKYITIEFIPKTYLVTIQNGLLNDAGSIRYTEKEDDSIVEKISNSSEVNFYIEHDTSKNIEITALPTHFVADIQIGGTDVDNIPSGANDYTMVLSADNIFDDTVISIQYSPFAYVVDFEYAENTTINEVEYDESDNSYNSISKKDTYDFGENPLFRFSTAEGYYLKALIVNGKAMDLYEPDIGFDVLDIVVNYTESSDDYSELTDERVTQFVLKIEDINSDYTIEPVYEEIFYNINIAFTGRGDVESDFERVNFGESTQIHASTDGGYYVKGYTVNNDEFVFSDMLEVQIIDITDITEDIFVMVEFSIATYIIAFDGSSGGGKNSSVRYESQQKRPLNESYVAEHNSSNKFTVYADEGYYISFVSINGEEIVIPYKATEQLLQIDNVTRYQHVVIKCSKLTYTVTASINNTDYGSVTDEVFVEHGENAEITISYESGYTLSSISEGSLSEGNTLLTISNVTQDKYVHVELESIPADVYSITVEQDGNGTVQYPDTIEHGEEIFIHIEADFGYVIDEIIFNGEEIVLTDTLASHVLSETITENAVIQLEFTEHAMSNPTTVNINQDGGTVNSMEGDTTIDVYEDANETALIEAAQNYFIYAINGDVFAEEPTQIAYILDGTINQVDIEYRPIKFQLNLDEPIQNGGAETRVSSLPDEDFVVSSVADYSEYIRIYLNPDEGYELDKIRINGVVATTDVGEDDFYTFSGIDEDQDIVVSFRPERFVITTEVTGGRGTISAPQNIFNYAQGMTINIMPDTGYNIKDVSVNGEWLEGSQLQSVIDDKKLHIAEDSELSKANILIRVNFEQINHDVEIELDGDGRI